MTLAPIISILRPDTTTLRALNLRQRNQEPNDLGPASHPCSLVAKLTLIEQTIISVIMWNTLSPLLLSCTANVPMDQ